MTAKDREKKMHAQKDPMWICITVIVHNNKKLENTYVFNN